MPSSFDESYSYFERIINGLEVKRPDWANPIRIQYKNRFLQVSGTIIPINLKGDRPDTPQRPWNGRKNNVGGITGYERGHIIGLQLGGPNVFRNIAPQTAGWQGAGRWRHFEKAVKEACQQCYGWSDQELPNYGGTFNRKHDRLCDINMKIYLWKQNIPDYYEGTLKCGNKKIDFKIFQPKAPLQKAYKWEGNWVQQRTVITDHYSLEGEPLQNVAIGLIALMMVCCGLCICGICAGIRYVLKKDVDDTKSEIEGDIL